AASLLGTLCRDTGRRDEAIHWYRSAADRGWATAMINLALLIEDDDREEAIRLTRRAAEVGDTVEPHYNLGIFLEEDGQPEEAERWYRQAAERIYPQARNRLASLLRRTGREAEAEAWYRRALDDHGGDLNEPDDEDYPTYTEIIFDLALLLEETGRGEEALLWYERAAERGDQEAAKESARLRASLRM
ncbi:tetratricopeptide repeat protein, partial [Planobispora rosea]